MSPYYLVLPYGAASVGGVESANQAMDFVSNGEGGVGACNAGCRVAELSSALGVLKQVSEFKLQVHQTVDFDPGTCLQEIVAIALFLAGNR